MKIFTKDNTSGYTTEEIEALNEKVDAKAKEMCIEAHTKEYEGAFQWFFSVHLLWGVSVTFMRSRNTCQYWPRKES